MEAELSTRKVSIILAPALGTHRVENIILAGLDHEGITKPETHWRREIKKKVRGSEVEYYWSEIRIKKQINFFLDFLNEELKTTGCVFHFPLQHSVQIVQPIFLLPVSIRSGHFRSRK